MAAVDAVPRRKSALQSLSSLRTLTSIRSGGPSSSPPSYNTPNVEQLYKAQEVNVTREKCRAAALGALVADAAGAQLHRLTPGEFERLISDSTFQEQPEFLPVDGEKRSSRGSLSPVGDAILPLLQSLVYHGGLDGPHFTQTSFNFFKQYRGEKSDLAKRFLLSVERGGRFPTAGVTSSSYECLTKVPLLVARYAGKFELTIKVRDAVRAHQSSADSINLGIAMAKILERVVLGCTILESLSWAQQTSCLDTAAHKHIQTVLQSLNVPHSVFVAKHGKNDKLPGAFLSSLHAAVTASSYQNGVRQTLKAGGACCGRAQLAGALLAAEDCSDAIPPFWIARVLKCSQYRDTISKLVALRVVVSIISY